MTIFFFTFGSTLVKVTLPSPIGTHNILLLFVVEEGSVAVCCVTGSSDTGDKFPVFAFSMHEKHTGTSSRSFGAASVQIVTSAQQIWTILLQWKHLCVGLRVKLVLVHRSPAQHLPFCRTLLMIEK